MEICDRYVEDMQLLLERDELGLEGRREFRIHLATCNVCADMYWNFQTLFIGLNRLPLYGPSATFNERVLSRVIKLNPSINESSKRTLVVRNWLKPVNENLDLRKIVTRIILVSLAILLGVFGEEVRSLLVGSTFVEFTNKIFLNSTEAALLIVRCAQFLFMNGLSPDLLKYLEIAVSLIGKITPVHDMHLLLPILLNGTFFYLFCLKMLFEQGRRRSVDVGSFD